MSDRPGNSPASAPTSVARADLAAFAAEENDSLRGIAPDAPVFAPPSPARATDVRAAEQWNGSWKQPYDGTAIITRRYARALDDAGIPVFVPSSGAYSRFSVEASVREEMTALIDRTPRSQPVRLYHLVPTEHTLRQALYPASSAQCDPEGAEDQHRRKILLSVWEQLPVGSWNTSMIARLLQCFAHHVVPCEHNAEVLRRAGIPEEKISVIHHPFEPADVIAMEQGKAARVREPGTYRFYTMGKWEPRKDALTVMIAALLAQKKLEGHGKLRPACPRLTLTVYTSDWYAPKNDGGYPSLADAFYRAAQEAMVPVKEAQQVITIDTRKHESHVPTHVEHDCFVTASHGEAWGMPAHDAVLAGNVLLAPKWGGFEAYMEGEGVPYAVVPRPRDGVHLFGSQKAAWVDVDPMVLAEHMAQCAFDDRKGQPLSDRNFKLQNPVDVGQQLRRVVETVIGPGYAWR